jgi:hypothetical protein
MVLYSLKRIKQVQPVKTYAITKCVHNLPDPLGTLDIESLSISLYNNVELGVELEIELDVEFELITGSNVFK